MMRFHCSSARQTTLSAKLCRAANNSGLRSPGLAPKTKLLVLDEPTASLDPASVQIIEQVIQDFRARRKGHFRLP